MNPARDDYFSVTGGDFTAEAAGRANFRMDNFDDGSTVAVIKGQVNVVHKNDTKLLAKGQSLTMSAGGATANVSSAPQSDDFDRWVSGREDSVVTATNAAMQYSNSSSYVSGFGDLYTYGGFYPIAGMGYGWQPYGVGAWLVTVRLRQLVLWVAIWMVFYRKPAVGMAALPLWWLVFPTWHRLVVDSDRIRRWQRACQIPSCYGDVCAFRQYRGNGSHSSAG